VITEGDKVHFNKSKTVYTVVALTYGENIWIIEALNHNLVGLDNWFKPRLVEAARCELVEKGKPVVVTGGN
jgi:hypothetical protein